MDFLIVIALFYGIIRVFTWIFDELENTGAVRYTGPTLNSMGRDDVEEMIRRSRK